MNLVRRSKQRAPALSSDAKRHGGGGGRKGGAHLPGCYSLALLLLNHVHQLQVGDQVGSVQWTRDGLTLGYDRDLPGFDRYYVLGNDEAGTYNLQVCISNKLCQHDLKLLVISAVFAQ